MTAMVRETSWDAVAHQEGEAMIELSSVHVEEVSGGIWWLPIAVRVIIGLLRPGIAE